MKQENLMKDMFAGALLRQPDNPFAAACKVFGLDTASALRAASEWINDTYVLTKQAELLDSLGEETFIPSRLTLARKVWELAESPGSEKKDRIAAYKLYAEIQGYIEKGVGAIVNNNTIVNQNRVMVVKDFGDDDSWENKAVEHQTKLIEHARS